jgi:hypothetical protein
MRLPRRVKVFMLFERKRMSRRSVRLAMRWLWSRHLDDRVKEERWEVAQAFTRRRFEYE